MGYFRDLTGQVSGTLLAVRYEGNSKWLCKCQQCGNDVIISTAWFNKNRELRHDGCKHIQRIRIGDAFGYLTVIGEAPDYIKPKSKAHEKKWKCQCICGRTKDVLESNLKSLKSTSCGFCKNRISIPEKMIYYYLKKYFDDICENFRPNWLNGMEIDIYLPSLNVGIEYDGERWHKDIEKDIEKDNVLKKQGIFLIRVREPKCPRLTSSSINIITPKPTTNATHMTEPIRQIIEILNSTFGLKIDADVNCLRDNANVCKTIVGTMGENSLQSSFPEIAKEWDYEKNNPLTPDKVSAHKGTKAWWICSKGHSYAAVIASRTGKDHTGCPICSGKGSAVNCNGKYLGTRSLQLIRPDIAMEFDVIKNGFTANDIAVSSNKKVWWKCPKCENEWQAKVNNRTSSLHTGCPKCARLENKQGIKHTKNLIEKNGSLLDVEPELCMEWDYFRNDIKPSECTRGSSLKVWWKCPRGHSYMAAISKRTGRKPTGCPYCRMKRVRNVETGEIFDSIKLAAESCGLNSYYKISDCCKDQKKTANGFHWKYVDD